MDSQVLIKQLRAEQRDIKNLTKSTDEGIRKSAMARFTELGLAIDAELLRHSQRVVSIV